MGTIKEDEVKGKRIDYTVEIKDNLLSYFAVIKYRGKVFWVGPGCSSAKQAQRSWYRLYDLIVEHRFKTNYGTI